MHGVCCGEDVAEASQSSAFLSLDQTKTENALPVCDIYSVEKVQSEPIRGRHAKKSEKKRKPMSDMAQINAEGEKGGWGVGE